MNFSPGEIPDEPGIDIAEKQFALFGPVSGAFDMIENPFQFCSRKIGVQHQSCIFPDVILQSRGFQFITDRSGSAALPDNGIIDRFARGFVPDDGGFTLIGNADRCDFFRRNTGGGQHFAGDTALRSPDFHGIMLHPAGLGIDLCEFVLSDFNRNAFPIVNDGSRTGGTLIKSQNIGFVHRSTPESQD